MATPWERIKRAGIIEFKNASSGLSPEDWNELLVQCIADYSVDAPLYKSTGPTLDGTTTDVPLPPDFIGSAELMSGSAGLLYEQGVIFDWVTGHAWEYGAYSVHHTAFIRFRSSAPGAVNFSYWGAHAPDASTFSNTDVTRIKPLYFAMGYEALESATSQRGSTGRVQAGPVSWDDGGLRAAYQAKSGVQRALYDKTVRFRGYGTRSIGTPFNYREDVVTTQGELIS